MHASQTKLDATAARNAFRREGEYWTIAYEGLVFRLRDTKGLRYLELLLRQPGQRHSAAAGSDNGEPPPGWSVRAPSQPTYRASNSAAANRVCTRYCASSSGSEWSEPCP
jgi:hypothetical protein